MSLWNLLVVLCFVILYLGLALVFSQLRHLRDELKIRDNDSSEPETSFQFAQSTARSDEANAAIQNGIQQIAHDIADLRAAMEHSLNAVPRQIQTEFQAIRTKIEYIEHRQDQFLDRIETTTAHPSSAPPPSSGSGSTPQQDNKEDAYREAKLLLANGVTEERVIAETGLTVEEVSLLKRLIRPGG